jgi:ribokinase
VLAALQIGREAGSITILNPAPADGLEASTLALVDVLTPNETELAALAGRAPAGDDPESAARHLLEGRGHAGESGLREAIGRGGAGDPACPAIVVTLGAAGALVVPSDGPVLVVGAPVVTPLDTTGAGDAFNGALAASLADGLDLLDAVRRAVTAASLSTTRQGARGGMPTRAELEEFLDRR